MITIPAGMRVLLASKPVDFRKGAHSLAALATERLGEGPFSGVVLVFRAKRGDRVKIVHWDASGLVLVWKQLEGGAFRWPAITDGSMRLSAVQFAVSCIRFPWTPICPTGERHGEVQHGREWTR